MADPRHMTIEISAGTIIKFLLLVVLVLFIYALQEIVIITLFAIILASAIAPFASFLERRGIPRLLSVLFLYLLVFGVMIFVVSQVVPFVSNDIIDLASAFPKIIEKISSSLETVQGTSPRYFDFVSEVQNILDLFSSYLQQFSQSAAGLVISIFGGLFSTVAIIVISFYLSVMRNGVEGFLRSILPTEWETQGIELWQRAELKVGRWLQGQMLLAIIMGLIIFVGLSLLGVKYALLLGVLIMILEIVPVAGPVLAAMPAIFLAFLQDPTLGLWVFLLYVIAQQIEGNILVPIILGKSTGLNPVVVILALLIGGHLAGIAGAIISVPVATILVEVLDTLARQKEARRTVA